MQFWRLLISLQTAIEHINMNSHLPGFFFSLLPNLAVFLCVLSPAAPLVSQVSLEAKMSWRAALLISIEMCLHWHQYSCIFLIPPVRSFPPLPSCLHIPSSLLLLLLLLLFHPSKLLMQGNPGLHQCDHSLDAPVRPQLSFCILAKAKWICIEKKPLSSFISLHWPWKKALQWIAIG